MPKISVISGVYNNESTIQAAIDSILSQTYSDWEYIICDDCSTDSTYAILRKYKETYPDKFVILKNSVNGGVHTALNKCLKYAAGDYIAVMDGDDVSYPERFEEEIKFLQSNSEYDILSAGIVRFDEFGNRKTLFNKERPNKNDVFKALQFVHPCMMTTARAVKSVGGYPKGERARRVEDYILCVNLYAAGYKGYNLQKNLLDKRENQCNMRKVPYKYRINGARATLYARKKLNQPLYKSVRALRGLIVGLLPEAVYKYIHKMRVLG